MTISTTSISTGPYSGNGTADTFVYDFKITDQDHLVVLETDDSAVESTLVVGTDFTVTGVGADSGGTVVRVAGNLPTGYTWLISRATPVTQLSDFESQGDFSPQFHEDAFDRVVSIAQETNEELGRTIRIESGNSALTPLAPLDGYIPQFTATGDVTQVSVATLLQTPAAEFASIGNIATLRASTDATISSVFVEGYSAAGDDGGGWFVLDPTDTTSADDGGTIILDSQGTPGRWKRLVDGPLRVQWFGADPTGATDSASAIRDCIAVANSSKLTGNSGIYGVLAQQTGTNPEVDFGKGIYAVGSSLTTAASAGTDYIKYVGEGAQLIDTTQAVDCFLGLAWDVHFDGIKFRGFDTQVEITTSNVNRAMFSFKHAEFIDPATSAVRTDSNSNSTEIIFDHFTAHSDEAGCVLFDIAVDYCVFKNFWIQNSCDVTFDNGNFMLLESGVLIPESPTNTQRWVDNNGQRFIVKHTRVSGEGGGKRLLDHRAAIDSTPPINAVQIILEDIEYYAVDEWIRLYEFPNLLQVQFTDDTDTTTNTGIWVDAVTDAQVKAWAREGTVNIDPRWGRTRVTNNAEVGAMMEIKNLKSHPLTNVTTRIDAAQVVSSGDTHFADWAGSTTTAEAGSSNIYGADNDTFTANSADDSVDHNDPDFLTYTELGREVFTFCYEITFTPASGLGQLELFGDIGYERYIQRLEPGTHVYSFPFVYLNGGGAGADTDLDKMQFQTGARMANGDVIEFGRWYLLEGIHNMNGINLEMIGSAAPGAISGTTGSNQAYYPGDIVWDVTPGAGAKMHICTAEGDPGTWITE